MKRAALYLSILAAVAFAIGFSSVFLRWPPVGFEAATVVFGLCIMLGVVCTFSAIILLVVRRFQNR